jgi:hypothetical protein
MESFRIMTTDGKIVCAVCDDKWETRKNKKYSTGTQSVSFISTISLLTKSGKHVSINFCDIHQKNLQAYTKPNEDSISVRNIISLKSKIFKKLRSIKK